MYPWVTNFPARGVRVVVCKLTQNVYRKVQRKAPADEITTTALCTYSFRSNASELCTHLLN